MTQSFAIAPQWTAALKAEGIRPADLLRAAHLPEDLFARPRPTLDPDSHRALWAALGDHHDAPALVIAQTRPDFDPALFSALCCPDLATAIDRVAIYKELTGPIALELHQTLGGLEITLEGNGLPPDYVASELLSLVHLARTALQTNLRPVGVEMTRAPAHRHYSEVFGREVRQGPFNRVVFTSDAAKQQLPSPDAGMFTGFDADLRPRLDDLDVSATTQDRVRTVLMEALPAGRADTELVASRLGTSGRSLQRRLAAEGTNFKDVLAALRTRLARHYLRAPNLSGAEIAFLLSYDDPNSFIRAFHGWTGTTPEAMRRELSGR